MIRKISIILILISLSGCMSRFQMKPENFSSNDQKQIVVFSLKLDYQGSENRVNRSPEFGSQNPSCNAYFSDNGSWNQFRSGDLKFKVKEDYIFVILDTNNDIYFSGIWCIQNKIFYNKVRTKKINKKIFSFRNNYNLNKIIYGGNIEIHWTPDIFETLDVAGIGGLTGDDDGSFTMRLTEDYSNYLEFMKKEYGFGPEKSINSFDKDILKILNSGTKN